MVGILESLKASGCECSGCRTPEAGSGTDRKVERCSKTVHIVRCNGAVGLPRPYGGIVQDEIDPMAGR